MKKVIMFLWGAIIASGWWGYGIFRYNNMLGDLPVWFQSFILVIFLGSAVTAVYIIGAFVHMFGKCWND